MEDYLTIQSDVTPVFLMLPCQASISSLSPCLELERKV